MRGEGGGGYLAKSKDFRAKNTCFMAFLTQSIIGFVYRLHQKKDELILPVFCIFCNRFFRTFVGPAQAGPGSLRRSAIALPIPYLSWARLRSHCLDPIPAYAGMTKFLLHKNFVKNSSFPGQK